MLNNIFPELVEKFEPKAMLRKADGLDRSPLIVQIEEHADSVAEFCRLYGHPVELVTVTEESGHYEPLYYIGPGPNGYTIEGVRNSIEELTEE